MSDTLEWVGIHEITRYEGGFRYDAEGNVLNDVIEVIVKKNLIVDAGKGLALDRLFGLGSPTPAVNIAALGVGTDSTPPASTDTKLNPVVAGTVVVKTLDAGTARTGLSVTASATFGTTDANFVWREAGLLNGPVNGTNTLFNRLVFGAFTKDATQSVVYRITITAA